MAIESICPGCGQRLAVPEEHAGKQARCPACQTIYTVPTAASAETAQGGFPAMDGGQGSSNAAESASSADGFSGGQVNPFSETVAGPQSNPEADRDAFAGQPSVSNEFWMRASDGTEYGPVDRTNLNRWFSEGRVGAGYQIRQGQNGAWQPAAAFQPQLNPYADHPSGGNPYAPSAAQSYSQYRKSDPSGLVLTMGILSWVCLLICPFIGFIPGLVAWITGRNGIRDIQAGVADPTNLTLVQVGYYLGMVNVLLTVLGFIAFFGLIAIGIIADM